MADKRIQGPVQGTGREVQCRRMSLKEGRLWWVRCFYLKKERFLGFYSSLSSGEAYSDRQLTTNFELWVEFFLCAYTSSYEDSNTVSVCTPSVRTPRNEITLASSISVLHYSLMHQWKGFHKLYSIEAQKFEFFFSKKFEIEFWLVPKSWNHLSFVNISLP